MFCLFVSRMTSLLYSFKKLMVCFVSPKWPCFKSLASCTTCLSVYVNLVKELLSLLSWLKCRFLASAPLKTCWPRGLFSKASAKVVSFCDTTKCFAKFFCIFVTFLWFLYYKQRSWQKTWINRGKWECLLKAGKFGLRMWYRLILKVGTSDSYNTGNTEVGNFGYPWDHVSSPKL